MFNLRGFFRREGAGLRVVNYKYSEIAPGSIRDISLLGWKNRSKWKTGNDGISIDLATIVSAGIKTDHVVIFKSGGAGVSKLKIKNPKQ